MLPGLAPCVVRRPAPPPGPFSFAFNDVFRSSTTWSPAGTVEFAGCNIGTPDPYRWVIVLGGGAADTETAVDDVQINGVSAEIIQNRRRVGSASPHPLAFVARLLVPAGLTCDVKIVEGSLTAGGFGISVFTATGGEQSVYSSGGKNVSGAATVSLPRPAQPSATAYVHVRDGSSDAQLGGLTVKTMNNTVSGKNVSGGYLTASAVGTYSHEAFAGAAAVGAVFV